MPYNKTSVGESFWSYWWYQLHLLSEHYPESPSLEDQHQIRRLFETLSQRFVCGICKRHFNHYISKNPYQDSLKSKNSLRVYFMNLHNDVNTKKKKKNFSLQEIINIYQDPQMKIKVITKTELDVCQYFDSRNMERFVLEMNQTRVEKNLRPMPFWQIKKEKPVKLTHNLIDESSEVSNNKPPPKKKKPG